MDTPGGGATYATLEHAKVAGWALIGPVEGDGPLSLPSEAFFTVFEVGAGGSPPVLIFDSRNDSDA